MIWLKKWILVIVVVCTCIGCDRVTKGIAQRRLDASPPISFLSGTIRLQYAENAGAMLSFGSELPEDNRFWFLTVFVGLLLLALSYFTLASRTLTSMQVIGLSMILGGGFGNLIDRIINDGHVIDFLTIGFGSLRTAVFNVADISILAGAAILLVASSRSIRRSTQPAPLPGSDGQ